MIARKKFNPEEWADISKQHTLNTETKTKETLSQHTNLRSLSGAETNTSKSIDKDLLCEVEETIQQIEKNQIDIAPKYIDWRNIGFTFADEFAESGRELFHRISKFYPEYEKTECDIQYDKCLLSFGSGITIATFFHMAKQAGIEISNNSYQNNSTIINLGEKKVPKQQINQNIFPIDVFPLPVQEIIRATNESLKFPIDFTGASMLYAVSVAIGNTHRVEIMKGYDQNAVLFLVLVGPRGTSKSHPLSFALKPIEDIDSLNFQKYQHNKQEYDLLASLTKKEREKEGHCELVKPVWEQHLVTDFTPEALSEVHKFNKKGLGVYSDELASWFKNFNRYNKGSEEQFWLSVWSGKPIRINRKTSEPIYIPLPFISVIGTIQTGILYELAKDRTENGFLDRLLFVVPDNLKKEYWSETEINPIFIENWQTVIFNILELSIVQDDKLIPKPSILRFTPEAKKFLFHWQKTLTDISNKAQTDVIKGINAKIEMYALRLALILEMMSFSCGHSDKTEVSIESVQGAIKLVEYFKNAALNVHCIVSNMSPLDKLSADKQALFNALPNYFTTAEAIQIAETFGMAPRTLNYFLTNKDFFYKLKTGKYEKLL